MSLGLDLTNVTENGGPVPAGNYAVVIDKAEVANTKAGNGQMIKVQMRLMDGQPHAGRVIFEQFNIKNPSAQAVQIGLGQLKGMMKAFGHPNPNTLNSTSELLGLKGRVTVKVEEQQGFDPQTRVKAYQPISADAGSAPSTPDAPAAAQAKDPFA